MALVMVILRSVKLLVLRGLLGAQEPRVQDTTRAHAIKSTSPLAKPAVTRLSAHTPYDIHEVIHLGLLLSLAVLRLQRRL